MTTQTQATGNEVADHMLTTLASFSADLKDLTASELVAVGQALTALVNEARALWRVETGKAATKTCQRCGNILMGLEQRGQVCNACLTKEHETAKQIDCITHRCPQCERTWRGTDLAAKGTFTDKVCGICAKEQEAETQATKLDHGTTATEPLADGTYTVEFGTGDYRTIKVKTQEPDATFMPGKRIASYLNGPDNWTNYKGFAFVNDDSTFSVWRKFQASSDLINALAVLCSGKEAMINGLMAYGMASGKCGVCSRKLTTPESIKRGIGPECAGRLGIA